MEDSVNLGTNVSSLSLDTIHFSRPTLLVGTARDSTGLSCVLTVDPLTLATIDTIYRSSFVPNVCRAVDLNADGEPDFLISLTSLYGDSLRFSAVIALYGPDYLLEDTLSLPRSAKDLLVNDDSKEIWMGYSHDTTIVTYQGTSSWHFNGLIGFVGAFDFNLQQCRFLGDSLAGQAFTLADVNSDGVMDVVALWFMAESGWCGGCAGPAPDPAWIATGTWTLDGATEAAYFKNWVELGSRTDTYDQNSIILYQQFPVVDFDGDGLAEAVLSWTWWYNKAGYPTRVDTYVEVFSQYHGQRRWKHLMPCGGCGPYAAIPYRYEAGGQPVLLLIGSDPTFPSQYAIHAVDGYTGDSLYTTEFRLVWNYNVVAPLVPGECDRVVHAVGSWLYRWRLDLVSSVDDESQPVVPDRLALSIPAPNPFNAKSRITYSVSTPMAVKLSVFDALGRHVATLVDVKQAAGDYEVTWDGVDSRGRGVASGVYFARLSASGQSLTRKMVLLK